MRLPAAIARTTAAGASRGAVALPSALIRAVCPAVSPTLPFEAHRCAIDSLVEQAAVAQAHRGATVAEQRHQRSAEVYIGSPDDEQAASLATRGAPGHATAGDRVAGSRVAHLAKRE